MKNSYEVVWEVNSNEYFSFCGTVWNVAKAKQILTKNPREIVYINPNSFEPLLGGLTSSNTFRMGVRIDSERLSSNKVDLSIPVIIVEQDRGSHMLIDGWHRLAKALKLKQNKMFAVVLSPIENKQILVR